LSLRAYCLSDAGFNLFLGLILVGVWSLVQPVRHVNIDLAETNPGDPCRIVVISLASELEQ
jgi:hypothetical protein